MATLKQAERWIAKWLKRLRLQQWDVSLVGVEDTAFDRNGDSYSVGRMDSSPDFLEGTMTLALKAEDVEEVVLHELLHMGASEAEYVFLRTVASASPEVAELLRDQYKAAQERWIRTLERAIWSMTDG